MKVSSSGNILSYVCTAIILAVIFALPIVLFLASGFAINIENYNVTAQSPAVSISEGLTIPDDILADMGVELGPSDVVVVSTSFYETALSACSGFIPILIGLLIIMTPLSELIQYFMCRRRGDELELSVSKSILPMFLIAFVSAAGALLVQITGYAAAYGQGLPLDRVAEDASTIMMFSGGMYFAIVVSIIVWLIPIFHNIFSSRPKKNLLEEDKSEFIDTKE